ncbi:glycosyltransferase family 2 protein [Psychroflexus sp. ALD_RP9]|uniref:glycosyltransferase family 2 protein n=1 Tax=Psychroflexus sp. ALD_RP9 TaxID=2777186 RepID=UPI001A8C0525|nr:glycosyltransferase family A protein [Psychroflexus sp. ALD_RP9]QSS96371.1 glycosyltransferase family 2 protein [Psychroflexus sp. ALD_RP9]
MKVLIIIPAHNEAEFIKETLHSLIQQTLLPAEVIVVNDNSTDSTEAIVEDFSKQYSFIKLINRSSSNTHEPGSKIVKAFNYGLSQTSITYIDIICKFDADLIFPPNYLEAIIQAFKDQPKLGIYGGFCSIKTNSGWKLENLTGNKHVRGALKAYSKKCFKSIGGLKPEMGWDTIDELLAQYYGFTVKTNSELVVKHLKPTGTRYKTALAKKFGISLHQIRYDIGLAVLTSLKIGYKKQSLKFFIISMLNFFKAKTKKIPYLVDSKQGIFIRKLRWKGVLDKLV